MSKSNRNKNHSNGRSKKKKSYSQFPKQYSDKAMAKRFESDLGDGYTLNYLQKIPFPYYKVRLRLLASVKPDQDEQQIHGVLLQLIQNRIQKEEEIKQFLGLLPPLFILRELYVLVARGLIVPLDKERFTLTQKGQEYLNGGLSWYNTEEIEYEFIIDGLSGRFSPSRTLSESRKENQLKPIFRGNRPSLKWLSEKWEDLCKIYQSEHKHHQLMDFIGVKKDCIAFSNLFYEDHYVFGYSETQAETPYMTWKVRDLKERELPDKVNYVRQSVEDRNNVFYDEEIVEILHKHRPKFETAHLQVQSEKSRFGHNRYKELKNFEIRTEMIEAIKTAKHAILIESPWIRKATARIIPLLKKFLANGGRVCILYGIDLKDEHHASTLNQLKKLSEDYNLDRFYFLNLPQHFRNQMIDMSGSHRKILLKDKELSIKGSFNFLSNNAKPTQRFAAEEATVFYDGTSKRWQEIFNEYQLPVKWLEFLSG